MVRHKSRFKQARIMLFIELGILIVLTFTTLWLRNVIIGTYYVIFLFSIITWLILLILTLRIYNEANN
jgi:hypothetical protein